jgi:hypothetical protein
MSHSDPVTSVTILTNRNWAFRDKCTCQKSPVTENGYTTAKRHNGMALDASNPFTMPLDRWLVAILSLAALAYACLAGFTR